MYYSNCDNKINCDSENRSCRSMIGCAEGRNGQSTPARVTRGKRLVLVFPGSRESLRAGRVTRPAASGLNHGEQEGKSPNLK